MTSFAIQPEDLRDVVARTLGDKARSLTVSLGEVTLVVAASDYLSVMEKLRTAPGCRRIPVHG